MEDHTAAEQYLTVTKEDRLAAEEKQKPAAAEYPPVTKKELSLIAPYLDRWPVQEKEKLPTVEYPPVTDNELSLISPYLKRWAVEDADEVVESSYFSDDDECRAAEMECTHSTVKKFLKQARESRGYDVDCHPPNSIGSPFYPRLLTNDDLHAQAIQVGNFALEHINSETVDKFGKHYEFWSIEKVVDTLGQKMLLTFTAKEFDAGADAKDVGADVPVKTFQAMVWAPFRQDFKFMEWRFKPGC